MITFDYDQFVAEYPEFVGYSTKQNVTNVFNMQATVMAQPISACFEDEDEQYYWICLVLAHILTRRQLGLSGRISNVSQGSESATFDMDAPAWAQYWNATVYGQDVYQTIQTYLAGGHYVSNGEEPYLGNAMNGAFATGFYQ
jgi:hypothetical protein